MRVLVDYHHHDLWESLELLFTDRLGWELYRPIGMDWFHEGYWNHERKWHGDAVARQYLEPWGSDTETRLDNSHGRYQLLVTLEQARGMKFDLVMSSLAHNHEGFARFAFENGAMFGLQIGNVRFSAADMAEDRWDLATFGLVSGYLPAEPPKPHVIYHQEFRGFDPAPPPRGDKFRVSSFVQCYPQDQGAYPYFLETARRDFGSIDWRVYGAYGEAPLDEYAAGNIDRCLGVADAMRASDVAWHAKRWSDGYGHVIHNWFSVGRPVFGFWDYYRDQMAGALWQEGVTSYDIGTKSPDEILRLIRELKADPDKHLRMCEAAAVRFREVVDFDEEEQRIRALFAQVLP